MNRRGFALIAALWLLVALSLVALDLSLRGRARRLAAANAREAAQGRAAAGAGVAHARALLERRLERAVERGGATVAASLDPWRELGSLLPDSQAVPGGWYHVRLRDAGAALNLNRCDEDELRRLLVALRVDAGDADRIAQAAMDWRDADGLRRGRGAEREEYVRAGAADLPSNAPFVDVAELRRVRGVSDPVFRRVEPFLTVLGSGQVNLGTAPREVLLSLPGINEEAASAIIRRRGGWRGLGSVADLGPELSPRAREAFLRDFPRLMARAT
ncbi:MAG TPA: hypothetical protein VGB66_03025, partial [Longimicrobium sp.]